MLGRAVYSPLLGLGTESGKRFCWCDSLHVSVQGKTAGTAHPGAPEHKAATVTHPGEEQQLFLCFLHF